MTSYILYDKDAHYEDKCQHTGHVYNVLIPFFVETENDFLITRDPIEKTNKYNLGGQKMQNSSFLVSINLV